MSGKVRSNQYLDGQTPKKPDTGAGCGDPAYRTCTLWLPLSKDGVSRTFCSKILTACSLYCSCSAFLIIRILAVKF